MTTGNPKIGKNPQQTCHKVAGATGRQKLSNTIGSDGIAVECKVIRVKKNGIGHWCAQHKGDGGSDKRADGRENEVGSGYLMI